MQFEKQHQRPDPVWFIDKESFVIHVFSNIDAILSSITVICFINQKNVIIIFNIFYLVI